MHKPKQKLIATLASSALLASGIATVHAQQGKPAGTPTDKTGVYSATPIHSESMAALERAAQRLRESIQSLAGKKEGPERNQAMDAARRALIDTQSAMIALPPEYRVAGIAVSNKPIVKANPAQNRTYGDSMKELQLASDRLREAIQAMAQRPAGESRNEAIKDAHAALFQTQQAMTLVPGMRPVATGAATPSDKTGAAMSSDKTSAATSSDKTSATTSSGKAGVYSATPIHSESMNALVRAAQRLRESVQSLAQKPAGAERDKAIELANKALVDTQQAMVALPAEYRVEGIVVSNRPVVKADPAQNRTFGDSMKELQIASDRLREAIQAMAQRPAGESRNEAIKDAHAALFQTQQAMTLVPGMRPVASGAATSSDKTSAATSSDKTSATTSSGKAGVYSATPIHSESMNALVRAAQRLRESVQSLAQKPAGAERDKAIELAKKALVDTQQAMIALPAEYRVEGIVVSNRPIVKSDPAQNRTFGDSVKELQLASDRLHQAIQAMAQRPAGAQRNDAIKQAHLALSETEQAIGMVPGPMASYPGAPDVTGSGKPASGAAGAGAKAPGGAGMQQGSGSSAGGASMQQGGAGGK